MATMFGRFEIQNEISRSETALIYKALDVESNQTVALKTQSLEGLGERAAAFVETLIAEGESTRSLASQNIVTLYGAGEIDGQFCAAMEYIQGNSVANMIARKEGFSIWDLLDITRQVCAALDKAAEVNVVHSSIEPAKIMVQWDGLVKVLGFGISNMSLIAAECGNGLGRLMPYCSPEQIRGEQMDRRSNLYTVGTILYEMVTGRKAFMGADAVALVNEIQNEMPAPPKTVNPKIHPAVSDLVMKAIAKDPADRYQTARELVADLETCKENGKKAAAEPKKTVAAPAATVDPAVRAAAAAKFTSSVATAADAGRKEVSSPKAATPKPVEPPRDVKAAAAAAGRIAGAGSSNTFTPPFANPPTPAGDASEKMNSGARMIELESKVEEAPAASFQPPNPFMSAAAIEQEPEVESPRVNVDPMMSAAAPATSGKSFSDLDELPPLKEPVFTAPEPEPEQAPAPVVQQIKPKRFYPEKEEKPRIQPREVAQKAINEISTIPPRLMLFSIMGAVAVILVVAVALFFHVHSEDDGLTASPNPVKKAAPQQAAATAAPGPSPVQIMAPPVEDQPDVTVRKVERRNKVVKTPTPPPQPVILPGQALIDSTPQGAQFQVDGKSDPSWVTPFTVAGLAPGKHIFNITKSGYTTEMRSVDIAQGTKSTLAVHLAPINALVVVNSTPAGAEITLDGRATGRLTPSQFAVEKGTHTVLLKKQGFLDETTTADLGPGQNFQYAPALRALGNADDIRTVGKFKKLFKGVGNESTAGMGTVSIHTQPKGAQIAINQHVLDKFAPVDVMLGPGNYVIDITLTGFKPLHKVISVEKGGKVAIDEILERN